MIKKGLWDGRFGAAVYPHENGGGNDIEEILRGVKLGDPSRYIVKRISG